MRNPLALSGRLIVAAVGKPMGRDYWHNDRRLYDVDGSVLYSAIQKKTYRDVARSAVCFALTIPLMVASATVLALDPSIVATPMCAIFNVIGIISFFNFLSDLRNSQIIHVAGGPARDDPSVRAGITDDVFGEDEDEEDEEDEGAEYEDVHEDEEDEEPVDAGPDNVVAFGAQKADGSELSESSQSGEVW